MNEHLIEKNHTISVLVENEFGVLARVAGMFAGRGFNIDALSVAPTADSKVSRITILTHGSAAIIEQMVKQLNRLVDVLKVADFSGTDCVGRELALVKVRYSANNKTALLQLVEQHGGRVLDEQTEKNMIFEFVQEHEILEGILRELSSFEILEVVRTGSAAMQKGKAFG